MNKILILDNEYEILDAEEKITLADSFVFNKIGTGHGEAKLYVGQNSQELNNFWNNFQSVSCFMLKEDLVNFLQTAAREYNYPTQPYQNPNKLLSSYLDGIETIGTYPEDIIYFSIHKVMVLPPRVYINSNDDIYTFIRKIGIPNISYLSVLKLRDKNGRILYYFKAFIDYSDDDYVDITGGINDIEKEIDASTDLSETEKIQIKKARKGQGKFREKLLEECPFCPITLVSDERLLIASHIKPWADAHTTNKERLDPKNGFALTPTYDKLFDKGFISFTYDRKMMVSPWLSPMTQKRLSIKNGMLIKFLPLDNEREKYLKYHRDNIFKK